MKPISSIDPLPLGIGAAVGLGEGIVTQKLTQNRRVTAYRVAVAATGLIGGHFGWRDDISIGMLVAAATLGASSIPAALAHKDRYFPDMYRPVQPRPENQAFRPPYSWGTGHSQAPTIAGMQTYGAKQAPTMAG